MTGCLALGDNKPLTATALIKQNRLAAEEIAEEHKGEWARVLDAFLGPIIKRVERIIDGNRED